METDKSFHRWETVCRAPRMLPLKLCLQPHQQMRQHRFRLWPKSSPLIFSYRKFQSQGWRKRRKMSATCKRYSNRIQRQMEHSSALIAWFRNHGLFEILGHVLGQQAVPCTILAVTTFAILMPIIRQV